MYVASFITTGGAVTICTDGGWLERSCQSREQKPVGLSPESESSLSAVALPPLLRPFKGSPFLQLFVLSTPSLAAITSQ